MPPLSLYIHVPWCIRKCPYCDFNSHAASDQLPEQEYVKALLDDLQQDAPWVQGRAISTLFFGGGTPSLLGPHAYETLFEGLHQQLTFSPDAEITLEANPGTFEAARFADYRSLGINRLSIGIQSFQPEQLKRLGRVHNADEAKAAVEIAHRVGFDNFNLDLMHGLPGQSVQLAMSDLQTALEFAPKHLSWYQLTIEPNTEFYTQPPVLPQEEILWDIQEAGFERLAAKGYEHYEVSAFCQPEHQARHNLNYWQFGDYLGIGAGAHGKLTLSDGTQIRTRKTRLPKDYLDHGKAYLVESTPISNQEIGLECLMNALRLNNGIPTELFYQRTGLQLADVQQPLAEAKEKGLLAVGDRIQPTEKGRIYLNELLALFLP